MKLAWTSALLTLAAATAFAAQPRPVELTGWFADENCAKARVQGGQVGPTGRECAQKQIASGVAMVFIDEEGKRLLRVANPESAADQESHYVRVSGSLEGETLRVASLEVLKEYTPSCRRPRPSKR